MAYRNTFFRWLFLYSLTFGLTYVLKLFTYLCPETGQNGCLGKKRSGGWEYRAHGLEVLTQKEPPMRDEK